jgi:hypothetical protein
LFQWIKRGGNDDATLSISVLGNSFEQPNRQKKKKGPNNHKNKEKETKEHEKCMKNTQNILGIVPNPSSLQIDRPSSLPFSHSLLARVVALTPFPSLFSVLPYLHYTSFRCG